MTTTPKKLGRPPASVKKETVHITITRDDLEFLQINWPTVSEAVRVLIAVYKGPAYKDKYSTDKP